MVCLTISYFQLVKKKYSDPDLLISVSTQILLASKDQWSPDSSNSWLLPACLKKILIRTCCLGPFYLNTNDFQGLSVHSLPHSWLLPTCLTKFGSRPACQDIFLF